MPRHLMPRDLSGQRFGRLLVLHLDVPSGVSHRQSRWMCRCDCGGEASVLRGSLVTGNTKSCGCLRREMLVDKLTTHGMRRTSEYDIWQKMIARCTDPRCKEYKFYGARGIKVCGAWAESFEAFYADVGPRPSKKHSLDRYPDNDGDYEVTNVRWATSAQQARNTRRNVLLTHGGRTMILKDWSEELGIGYNVLRARLRRGWTVEETLTTPVQRIGLT